MIRYDIIATGSDGNATVIEDKILIDCGVPFGKLKRHAPALKLVLLTHIHSDHFRRPTIKKLAKERPTLRFGCARWLVDALLNCGVSKSNIDVLDAGTGYGYGICTIFPLELVHNVPNLGYKIHFSNGDKMIYATDTNNLNGITAQNYDLYMIEANYAEAAIAEKIEKKTAAGQFAYEMQVVNNHLSKEKCDDWLYRNLGERSQYVYMHQHKEDSDDHDGEDPGVGRPKADPTTGSNDRPDDPAEAYRLGGTAAE